MSESPTITYVGVAEEASSRGGPELSRVTEKISVDVLRDKFTQFMQSLEAAFAVDGVQTAHGVFQLSEIQFSAEISAEGEFKLLGTGVGVAAGASLDVRVDAQRRQIAKRGHTDGNARRHQLRLRKAARNC